MVATAARYSPAELLRWLLYWWYKLTRQIDRLYERMIFTEVGWTGHVSLLDQDIAKQKGFEQLTRLERWMLKDLIAFERKRRREIWRQSVIKATGEDPYA